ncbi:MAG: 30S ribosomal protein S21 [Candidatus Pacebacteria bacterium]|jgi:ribosomal protein S21|nr:30S ribosomal protein S21 [Candidatus Paceibacterota bacterium]
MAMTNVEITKNPNENGGSLLRRFSRKVQEAGIIPKVKGGRYAKRKTSKLSLKTIALKKISRRNEVEKLKKLGKMA